MKRLLFLIWVLPALALAQGVEHSPLSAYRGSYPSIGLQGGGEPANSISFGLDAHGGLLPNSSAIVSHVYFDGSGIHDSIAPAAWTMTGTVPVSQQGAFFPDGLTAGAMYSAGPFSSSNYYQTATNANPYRFPSGSFMICARFTGPPSLAAQYPIGNFNAGNTGFRMQLASTGQVQFYYYQAGTLRVAIAGTGTNAWTYGPNVLCGGFDAATGTGYVRLNFFTSGTSVNAGAYSDVAATGTTATIGYPGSNAFTGTLAEVVAWNSPFTDAAATSVASYWLGMTINGVDTTNSRNSPASYTDNAGNTWTAAQFITRLAYGSATQYGALIEASSTNYALNSSTHPKTSEATASMPLGASVCWHRGAGTMTVAASGAVVTGLSCSAVSAGTPCTFTVTTAGTMSVTTTSGTTHVQCEPGSVPTSWIPTAAASASRPADVVTAAAPSWFKGSKWSLEGVVAPYGSRSWGGAALPAIVSVGTAGSASSGRLYADGSGNLVIDSYDGSTTLRRATYAHGFSASSQHRVVGGVASMVPAIGVDGSFVTVTSSGSGTGKINSPPALMYLGQTSAAGTQLNGYLREVKIKTVKQLVAGAVPEASTMFRLGLISDTHMTNTGHTVSAGEASTQMTSWGPDLLAHLGDIVYEGSDPTYTTLITALLSAYGGAPHAFAIGNHDTPNMTLASLRAALPAEQRAWAQAGVMYGSTDVGPVHVVVLDCEYSNASPYDHAPPQSTYGYCPPSELTWLASDLDATIRPTVVMMHRGIASPTTDSVHWLENYAALRAVLEPRASKLVAVINGHSHMPDNAEVNGIRYFSVGALSSPFTSYTTHDKGTHSQLEINTAAKTYRFSWWENDSVNGYLEVHVVSGSY